MSETFLQKQMRLQFESWGATIADKMRELLPKTVGFTLFVFDYGERGNMAYYSRSERSDSRAMIREWLRHTDAEALQRDGDLDTYDDVTRGILKAIEALRAGKSNAYVTTMLETIAGATSILSKRGAS